MRLQENKAIPFVSLSSVHYRPVFSESLLGFEVSSGELGIARMRPSRRRHKRAPAPRASSRKDHELCVLADIFSQQRRCDTWMLALRPSSARDHFYLRGTPSQ